MDVSYLFSFLKYSNFLSYLFYKILTVFCLIVLALNNPMHMVHTLFQLIIDQDIIIFRHTFCFFKSSGQP